MRRGVEAGLLATAAFVVLAGGVSAAQQVTEPLLRIGLLDGPPEYTFSQVTAVQQLPGGQVLVVDAEVPAVRIFDAEGRYLRSLGRRGDGPGEFQRPLSASLRDDGIRIFDHGLQRVVHFDLEGTHLGTRRLPEHAWRIRDPQPVRGGWRVAWQGGSFSMDHARILVSGAGDAREAGAGVVHMVVFDDARIDTVATGQTGWVYGYDSDGATMVNSVGGELGDPLLWTVGGDSLVLVVDGTVGDLTWHRVEDGAEPPLRPTSHRSLGLEPRSAEVPLARLQALLDSRGYAHRMTVFGPDHLSHFSGALLDDRGWAWLQRSPPDTAADTEALPPSRFVVAPLDGRSTFEVELPPGFSALSIHQDRILGVRLDELEVPYVEVYRLREGRPAHAPPP